MVDKNTENPDNTNNPESSGTGKSPEKQDGKKEILKMVAKEFSEFKNNSEYKNNSTFQNANDIFASFVDWLAKKGKNNILEQLKIALSKENIVWDDIKDFEISYGTTIEYVLNTEIEQKLTKPVKKAVCSKFLEKIENTLSNTDIFPYEILEKWEEFKDILGEDILNIENLLELGKAIEEFLEYLKDNGINYTKEQIDTIKSIKISNADILNELHKTGGIETDSFDIISKVTNISRRENIHGKLKDALNDIEALLLTESVSYLGEDLKNYEQVAFDISNSFNIPTLNSIFKNAKYIPSNQDLKESLKENEIAINRLNPSKDKNRTILLNLFFRIGKKNENLGKALISLYQKNFNINALTTTEQNSILKELAEEYKKNYLENVAKLVGVTTPEKIQNFGELVDDLFDMSKETVRVAYKEGKETKYLNIGIKKHLRHQQVETNKIDLNDYNGVFMDFEVEVPPYLEEIFKKTVENTSSAYSNFAGQNISPAYKVSIQDKVSKKTTSGYPQIYFENGVKKIKLFKTRFADATVERPLIEGIDENVFYSDLNLIINDKDRKLFLSEERISDIMFLFCSIIGTDEPLEKEDTQVIEDIFDNIDFEYELIQNNPLIENLEQFEYAYSDFSNLKNHEINTNTDMLDEGERHGSEKINGIEKSLISINNDIINFDNLENTFSQLEKLTAEDIGIFEAVFGNLKTNLGILNTNLKDTEAFLVGNTDLHDKFRNTLNWIQKTMKFQEKLTEKLASIEVGMYYYNDKWENDEETNKEFLDYIKENIFYPNQSNTNFNQAGDNFEKIKEIFEELNILTENANKVLDNGKAEIEESIDKDGEEEDKNEISTRIEELKKLINENISQRFTNIFENRNMEDKDTQIAELSSLIHTLSGLDNEIDKIWESIDENEDLKDDLTTLFYDLEELGKAIKQLVEKANKLLEEIKNTGENNETTNTGTNPEDREKNEIKELLKEWDGIDGDSELEFPNKEKNKKNTILYAYFDNSKLPGGGNHLVKMEILGSKNPYKFQISSAEFPGKGEFTKEVVLNAQNLRLIKSQFDKFCKFKKVDTLKDFFDYINNFSIKTDNNKAINNIKTWQKDKGIEFDGSTLQKKNDKGVLKEIKYIGKTLNKYDKEEKKTVGCFYKVEFGANSVKLIYEGGGYSQEMDYNSFMMFISEKGLTAYTKEEYKNTIQNIELEKAGTKGPKVWMSIGTIIKSLKKFPEQVKWKLEQRNNFKTAKLYSMFAKALPPIGILGQIRNEAISEEDSAIWSVIQKYKERVSRADVGGGGVHAKQSAKTIEKDIFEAKMFKGSEFQYKAVGYLIYAIEKGGGPYFRGLNKYAGQGLWVKAILGEGHQKKYLLKMRDLEKKVKENPGDEDALDQLIKSEIFYIKDSMPGEIFGTQAGSAIEGAYINMFADSKVSDIKKSEEAKSEFLDVYGGFNAYFDHLRAPNMLSALQAMVGKIDNEGLYKDFYRCMLIPVISGVSQFNWLRNNRDEFKAIGRTYALPITTFVDEGNGPEKIVKIIDYISKKNGLSGDNVFSKAIGWKKEDITMSNYSKGHSKMFKNMEKWWDSHGDMVIRALNYGEDYLLKAQEDEKCEHNTKEVIKEYFDNKVNMKFTEEWTSSTKGFISAEALPFYKNGMLNLGAGPIDNFMMSFGDGKFKHKFAEGMWETLQNKIINMDSKGAEKYEVKFLLQKYNTWFKKNYYDEMKYMVSALSKVKKEGEPAYKYLTPFMKRQISRKKRDNEVPEIIDNTLGEFQKFFIKNINLIDEDMIKDVFGDQLAESFKPEIVEQFNPGGYSVNRTKGVKDREKFINLFDNDFNI